MGKVKLSIIIPNYNKMPYLGILLSQIKDQLVPGVEVIVVDDCSTDDSWKEILKYKDIFKIFRNPKNAWVSHTRNVGLDKAQGDYITFLDSDDEILPNFMSYILSNIESGHDGYFFDYDLRNVLDDSPVEKAYNIMVWSKVFKKSVLDSNNIRFDEEFFQCYVLSEDMDFCCHFVEATEDIIVDHTPIILYNWGVLESVSNGHQITPAEEFWADHFVDEHPYVMDKYFK